MYICKNINSILFIHLFKLEFSYKAIKKIQERIMKQMKNK